MIEPWEARESRFEIQSPAALKSIIFNVIVGRRSELHFFTLSSLSWTYIKAYSKVRKKVMLENSQFILSGVQNKSHLL